MVDITPEGGSIVRCFIVIAQADILNQRGETVGRSITRFSNFRCRVKPGCEKDPFVHPFNRYMHPAHQYTDADYDYLKSIWEKETIRGAEPLYWDDVNIGDYTPVTAEPPFTQMDMIRMYGQELIGCESVKGQVLSGRIRGQKNEYGVYENIISHYKPGRSPFYNYSCLDYAYNESKLRMHGDLVDFNGSINADGARELALINTIRDCAADGCRGFALEYNPVIDAKTGAINGAEATIYWQDADHGRVEPESFMPILERDFIFEELGDFMLQQGLSDGVKLLEKDPSFLLCLNVYRTQLESNYFMDNLTHYLNATGFPPHLLSLKFDNDCRFLGMDIMRSIIARLHELRVLTIIGDFGSGTDSLRFLAGEPVDAVRSAGTSSSAWPKTAGPGTPWTT